MIDKITLPEENYNVPDYDEKLANKTNEIVDEVNDQELNIGQLTNQVNLHNTEIIELKKEKGFAQVHTLPSSNLTVSSASSVIISGIPEIEIDVSKDNANIYVQVIMLASVNTQVGNITFFVDGSPLGRLNSTNQQSETTLNTVHILEGISKGKHKIRVGAYTQSTSSTLTIRAYNSVQLLAYEI